MTTKRNYGWIAGRPDPRDIPLKTMRVAQLPSSIDLRAAHKWPAVYDQGALGSCTANAIAAACEYEQIKLGKKPVMPSRLMIYYDERVIERTVKSDAGAQIRDGVKSVTKRGVCPEKLWPYNTAKFAIKPPAKCYVATTDWKAAGYRSVAVDPAAIKAALAANFPVIVGFTVFDSFESEQVASTGVVPMPDVHAEKELGGHAVLIVGYDDATQRFLVRNSWGAAWSPAMGGYFTAPYEYLGNPQFASDLWVLQP